MALIDFQTAMGRLVRAPDGGDPLRGLKLDERDQSSLTALTQCPGFRVTVAIQRSWCEGRAAKAAHLTLSLLTEDHRARLLEEWVNSGAGTSSFFEAEADEFLAFLGARLDESSPASTICRIERATLRASAGAACFVRPDLSRLDDTSVVVRCERFASLIHSEAPPHRLLFGPGLESLWRAASQREADLWDRLPAPAMVRDLSGAADRQALEALLDAGVVDLLQHRE